MSVTSFSNGIPVVSIPVSINSISNGATLPWNGLSKPYQWTIVLSVTAQPQSGVNTRQKFQYNGQDINVGMWVANLSTGLAWEIVSISSKSATTVTCVVQDIFRYNTYRDPSKSGKGTPVAGASVVFELATDGTPMIDPAPAGIGSNFLSTLVSRFAYDSQEQYDFPLSQPGNTTVTFTPGQIVAIDEPTQTFVLADASHTATTVGQVTAVDDTGTVFSVNPIGKVIDNFNYLPGQVGQFLYTNPSTPGQLTTTAGGAQIYLQIRNHTPSTTTSGTFSSATTAITTVGNTFYVNGVLATVANAGSLTDIANAVNATTSTSGVTATIAGSYYIQFTAVDAREIGFADVAGSTTLDAGLISVENGIKGAVIVVTSSASGTSGVSSITAGTGISVNASTGAVVITNTQVPPSGLLHSYGYVYVQNTASQTWTINHNGGTTNVLTQIYDATTGTAAAGNTILPDNISIIDINNIQVTFGSAQTGTALLNILK